MAGSQTPATRAASQAGIDYTVHSYEHDPRAESYGQEAADALGVDAHRVFKTLVARTDSGDLVCGVVPVRCQLDVKALARAVGAKKATMAPATEAERATGYVLGGISPLGQKRSLPTVVDVTAEQHATVLVSAGRRGLEIELSPADLCAMTAGTTAPIAR